MTGTFDCEGCGDLLEVGVPHDCPVLGTTVLLTDKEDAMTTTTDQLTPLEALRRISEQLGEFDSFAEGFDHENHGDQPDYDDWEGEGQYEDDPDFECRFDQAHTAGTFEALTRLIAAAQGVVMAEPDELFEGKLDELAAALGIPR